MMKMIIMLLFVLLNSCTTVEFVRRDITPKRQAILKYTPQSKDSDETKYRMELNKKARDFCGGDFQITKEYQAREPSNSTVGIGTGFGIGSASSIFVGGADRGTSIYQFVEFDCK